MSSVGDGMVAVALPLLALRFTRSPLAIAAVLVFERIPGLLASLPIGTIADRINRRTLLISIEILRFIALGAFALAVLLHHDGLGLIYPTAFVLGTLQVSFDVVSGASLASVVSPANLVRANAHLINAEQTAEDVVGRGLGGIAFAAMQALPFLADALSFVFSAAILRRAIPDNSPKRSESTHLQDLREGVRWFLAQPMLRRITVVVANLAFCQGMVFGVLALYARDQLHLSGTGYGLLLGGSSFGIILGGVLAPRVHQRLGTAWALLGAGVLAGSAYPILALTHSFAVATGALLVETAMVVVGNTASRSLRQGLVPADMQGRSTSVYLCTILGSYPLGALLGGLLVSLYGLQGAFSTAGALQLAVIAVVGPRLVKSSRAAGSASAIDLREVPDLRDEAPATPGPESEQALTAEAR